MVGTFMKTNIAYVSINYQRALIIPNLVGAEIREKFIQ
jgi:hypothetical protein